MLSIPSRVARLAVGSAAFALTVLPASSVVRPARTRTDIASSGAVARELTPKAAVEARSKAAVRQALTMRGAGTYIGEMLAERDSGLARWHDLRGVPLKVWIQPESDIDQWRPTYPASVRDAFLAWDAVELPVRFAFTADSAAADVHVTFIDHFDEPISGRTKWARDDDWWIIDADIVLAVHHQSGRTLDDEAMKAMALHETGHLLGLDHTEDQTSIMAPRVRVRALSSADLATVRLLYTLPPGGVR
ncbi:MAG TPA: matrixin family metalloprotease [Gemmatimonadaceae bacterium]|nr:matrixin family metalloprotease [Gemmatimonadaceae bacterium]